MTLVPPGRAERTPTTNRRSETSSNSLRWRGRPGWYEVWYLIVSGRFWLRYTIHVPDDPAQEGEAALWLASFEERPSARKQVFPLESFRVPAGGWPLELGPARLGDSEAAGRMDGAAWELRFEALAPPLELLPAVARPVAKTRLVVTAPVLAVSGTVEVDGTSHELDSALGHQAHVFGSRHAERFGWAHASLPGGRFIEALTAKTSRLPEISLYATERRRRFARARLEPGDWRVGPFTVAADPGSFVGVTYRDPDGTALYCYHSERGRLRGPGVEADDCSVEYAARAKVPGWPVSI
jgi:hypothetical protein